MTNIQEAAARLRRLLDKIEEDAQVDFLGTGSNSRLADREEAAWRQLFVEAKQVLCSLVHADDAEPLDDEENERLKQQCDDADLLLGSGWQQVVEIAKGEAGPVAALNVQCCKLAGEVAELKSAKELWAKNHGKVAAELADVKKQAAADERRCKAIEESRDKSFNELSQARAEAAEAKGGAANSMDQWMKTDKAWKEQLQRAEAAEAERDKYREGFCHALFVLWGDGQQKLAAAEADVKRIMRELGIDWNGEQVAPQAEKPQ
jgi:hypothetical protein